MFHEREMNENKFKPMSRELYLTSNKLQEDFLSRLDVSNTALMQYCGYYFHQSPQYLNNLSSVNIRRYYFCK